MEVLLFLIDKQLLPYLPQAPAGAAEAVRLLVRLQPDRPWSLAAVAQSLGLGTATLRRRLDGEGTSLRRILESERMAVAHALLKIPGHSVESVALACGYASRSRFADRFRRTYGVTPSRLGTS